MQHHMKIIIISLNPVIDTHYYADEFIINRENFTNRICSYPGGKGVNVAKALKALGSPYELYLLLGDNNSMFYEKLLNDFDIEYAPTYCSGKTRENISIHANNICETRLCSNEFSANDQDCLKIFEEIKKISGPEDVVVFSGRLPSKVSKDKIALYLSELRSKGCLLIVDSASFDKDDYKIIKPYLIKPNEYEILLLGKNKIMAIDSLLNCEVENIAVSEGENGIELYSKNKKIMCQPPHIKPVSTVGAGDSSIAGFAYAISKNFSTENMLKFSVACGTACCLTEGGMAPTKEQILTIYNEINCI